MIITIYDTTTGEIKRAANVPDSMVQLQISEGEAYIETTHLGMGNLEYIDLSIESLTQGPEMDITINKTTIQADGIDTAMLSVLPDDCIVMVNDTSYDVSDNVFELTLVLPEVCLVTIIKFPFLPKEVTIEGII